MKTEPTKADIDQAWIWLHNHPVHVGKLMATTNDSVAPTNDSVAPSGSDCSRPELWKDIHWRWLHSSEAIRIDLPDTAKKVPDDVEATA